MVQHSCLLKLLMAAASQPGVGCLLFLLGGADEGGVGDEKDEEEGTEENREFCHFSFLRGYRFRIIS